MHKTVKILILLILSACSVSRNAIFEEPKQSSSETYIKHFAYSLGYNQQAKQANWVAYKLKPNHTVPNFKRTNKFLIDTLVPTGTATNADYKKSGFDRGHFAPAADMAWNKQAMRESFYFSNISPQLPQFNRAIWKKLESKVRLWATKYDSIYICAGPIFINPTQHIGKNNVTIPSHFYKTVVIYNDTIKQGIGFVFPHEKCNKALFNYATSIDSIEQLINYDLYHSLPNRHEKKIEKFYYLQYWDIKYE